MQIMVNNQPVELEASLSLEALLTKLSYMGSGIMDSGIIEKGIALAVNRQIISRSQWSTHTLGEGDAVTLIKATAGG